MSEENECHPNNLYGLSKLLAENIVNYEVNNGLKAVIVRPFMIYDEDETIGIHRSAMIRFAENLIRGREITIHQGAKRSWLHIDDAVNAFEQLLYVSNPLLINIAYPIVVDMTMRAAAMCNRLNLDFDKSVNIIDLPEKMTLQKYPHLVLQDHYLNFNPNIDLNEGIDRVLKKVKERIK